MQSRARHPRRRGQGRDTCASGSPPVQIPELNGGWSTPLTGGSRRTNRLAGDPRGAGGQANRHRALADGRGDALDRAGVDIADGEDPRAARLQEETAGRPPNRSRLPSGTSRPVRRKPSSSIATTSRSQWVCGEAPMKTKSAFAGTPSARRCGCPRHEGLERALALQPTTSRVRAHLDLRALIDLVDEVARHRLGEITAADEKAAGRELWERNIAAWPAELPPPTITTGSPTQSCASAWVAA